MDVVLKDVTYWENAASTSGAVPSILLQKDQKGPVPELRKLILDGISIRFAPGTVTAIYGYGDGCAALLSILSAQQKTAGHISGSVLYDDSIRSVGAYCDIARCSTLPLTAFSDLSVYDYLFWAARLRVNVSRPECRCVTLYY